MKLRNKKTGEINLGDLHLDDSNSLAELNDEWEDYEEPKGYWSVDPFGDPVEVSALSSSLIEKLRRIGNLFQTEEEAEKAVKKLRAWKRLKDKGFKFNGVTPMEYFIRFTYDKPRQILDNQQHPEVAQQFNKDLALLFGGEE